MSFGFSIGDFLAAFELVNKVRTRYKDAPSEFESIKNNVETVANILQSIGDLGTEIDLNQQQTDDLTQACSSCKLILARCNTLVDKYSKITVTKHGTSSRVARIWTRVRLDSDDIRHLRDQLAMSLSQLTVLQEAIELRLIQSVSENVEELKLSDDQRERETIADWYAPSKFADQQSNYLKQRRPGTGNWFLEDDRYKQWREGTATSSTLLCPGIPGSGKTMMFATVIDDLRKHIEPRKNEVVVVYFYCNFNRRDEQELEHIYASLVRQLFQEQPSVPEAVRDVYLSHRDRKTRPSLAELRSLLQTLIQQLAQVYILIDALDEANITNNCRDQLLDDLFRLGTNSNQSTISLLFTTRFIPTILQQFRNCIQIEVRAAKEDVENYIDTRMLELGNVVKQRPDLQTEIKTQISGLVDGMFLLARLHFDALIGHTNPRSLRHTLNNLPKGNRDLKQAYDIARERIERQSEHQSLLARQVLAWITYAKRELVVTELQQAIAVQPGMKTIDPQEDFDSEEDILSVCAGLVVVESRSRVVRLIHYTTQEYLETVRTQWFPDAQINITQSCLAYMKLESSHGVLRRVDPAYVRNLHPFLSYAAQQWGYHAVNLKHQETETQIMEYLSSGGTTRLNTRLIRFCQYRQHITSLHICAYFDLCIIAEKLIDQGALVNARDSRQSTPLSWAARFNNVDMTQLLLASSAEVDASNEDGRTPLSGVASSGQKEVLNLLLASSAEIDKQDQSGRTPLSWAAGSSDCEENIKILIATGASIDLKDKNNQTPLAWAARSASCERNIEILIGAGASIDLEARNGRTPLSWAAQDAECEENLKVLIAAGASIDVKDDSGRTPLSWAAEQTGCEENVRVLLAAGAGIDLEDIGGRTPLARAAYGSNCEEIIEILIAAGASIDCKDDSGRTPLSWAAQGMSSEWNIKALIAAGAVLDMEDDSGRTPLSWAAGSAERGENIEILIAAGAGIDVKDRNGRTPLSWAAEGYFCEDNVKTLIAAGAGVNVKDNNGRTPLDWATEGYDGDESVRILKIAGGRHGV